MIKNTYLYMNKLMSDGRQINNPSWIDNNNDYDTELSIPEEWKSMFDNIDLTSIQHFLAKELSELGDYIPIYPPKQLVLNAFKITKPDKLRVVILGQDPYINEEEAMGLAFSVPENKRLPPSLRNIYKKIGKKTKSGDLTSWAEQGVLLLNTSLTVRARSSNSHSTEWRKITDKIIKYLSDNFNDLVFILWGGNALGKKEWIDGNKHSILISSHPSPLGCSKPLKGYSSFNNCDHFNQCNNLIKGDKIIF